MKGLNNHTKVGFNHNSLHAKKEPHPLFYLKQRASFWVASLSLFTFLIGNMMGQHGWYGFWASVLGKENIGVIAYVGTVTPLETVVDYDCWADFGGDYKVHTFRQAPDECHRSPPLYTTNAERNRIFSMQYMSSYANTTEDSGTHSGVDIRVPVGTPVRSVMAGKVYSTGNQPNGFGKYVVIAHPNAPDPNNPSGETVTLYSEYAHLSAQYVNIGDIVQKGESIALSGNTGKSSGPHLHFSIARDGAPFLPFYPSSKTAGYAYTVNPLLYVQSNFDSIEQPSSTAVALTSTPRTVAVPDPLPQQSRTTIIARLQSRRESRIRERLAARQSRQVVALQTGLTTQFSSASSSVSSVTRKVAAETTVVSNRTGTVDSVEISHDGSFSGPGWEKVTIRLLDSDGNTVINPDLDRDLVLRSEFGKARIVPSVLSRFDFEQGEATVNMRPLENRTVVITVLPFHVVSRPMKYER